MAGLCHGSGTGSGSGSPRARRSGLVTACGLALALLAGLPSLAHVPGSGTLYSDDFAGTLDEGWEGSNGVTPNPSPWTQGLHDGDLCFVADGYGPYGNSPTLHWARHVLHPVTATSFSLVFDYESEQGTGSFFDLEVEQRATTLRKYRLRVDGDGALSLWRSEAGVMTLMVSTPDRTVPRNKHRWIRFSVESDPSGHPRVRARVWQGNAGSEPGTWTLEFLDDLDTLDRVHRFELWAEGDRGVHTWIDDIDAWGDVGSGVASSVTEIWVAELAHLDIGFTEPPDDVEAFAKTHLDQVLNNLDADPDYRWIIEEGWWLDRWWERSGETQRQRMIQHLQGGRLALGAGYASLHTTTAGHEELTRNLYYSSRMAREHGFPLRTWITNDVPGSTFALPELIARSGIDYFLGGMNSTFGGQVDAPGQGDRPFWWVGPDGSKVLAWTTFDSYAEGFQYGFSFFDNLSDLYRKLGAKLPEQEEAGYDYPELMLLRGFDNHYQGFHTRNLIDQWNATYDTPVFRLATPEEFLDHMLATYGAAAFPEYSGDYGCAWSNSHATAQHTEEWVRRSHREGRAAEALLAAGVSLDGAPAPLDETAFLYRRMLEVDEHSGAGGWPEYFTPEEMDRNNTIHLGYAEDARDTARSLLVQGLDRATAGLSAAGDAVAAVNPLGRSRDGWVRVELPPEIYGTTFRVVDRGSGVEAPFQRLDATSEILFRADAVPSMGYRVFDLLPGSPTAVPEGLLSVTGTTLENDLYRVEIDANDGSVVSLYDKAAGRELVETASAYRFNELASNTKQQYDYQNPPVAEPPSSASVAVELDGPLLASLRVTRTGTPHVETTYRLYRGEDRVEFENVLDEDLMPYVPQSVSVRAYTVTLPFDVHDFDIRTETTTRFLDPLSDGFPRPNLFDWHNVEHSMAFWDAGGGVLYAIDAVDAHHIENLSSLASGSFSNGDALILSRMKNRVDEYTFAGGSVGSFDIEPGTSPLFRYTHHVRSTPATFDPVATSRFGFEALNPLQPVLLSHRPGDLPAASGSFFRVDAPAVLLYTAKPAEDGDGVILRMTELAGAPVTATVSSDVFLLESPELVEQDEEGGAPLPGDGQSVDVSFGAYETLTVRVRPRVRWAPLTLTVDKDRSGGDVVLAWTGGNAPFTLTRADDAGFSQGVITLEDEQPVTSHDDPVLGDGRIYFYVAE